ncbi:MAG TPA: ABC transporter permease [Thiotrichales bacterium]|nr:ABC transporter permease [Thiotrichales bacterium]
MAVTSTFWGIALRNLWRSRGRTAVAAATIAFGVVSLLLAGGFIEWIFWAMRVATIESRLGHVQIVRQGYLDAGIKAPFDYLLPEKSAVLDALLQDPEVEMVTPRLSFGGLISHGDNSISFLGEGVVPEKEAVVSRWLILMRGEPLSSSAPDRIILGRGLARNLGVEVGDPVVLLVNTPAGGINAAEVRVGGIFRTSAKAFDDSTLRVPLPLAKRLLRVDGAHRWVVLLKDTERTDDVIAEWRARFGGQGLEFVPWYRLADFYNKTVALFSRQVNVVRGIIGLIIVLAITNALIMTVLERTGEIGTLMALGYRRRQILALFMREGVVLGLFGTLIGVVVGLVLAALISAVGIPMPPPPGTETGFTGKIRITGALLTSTMALALLTTALASVYPAWKASRMQVVDALRHNR